MRTLLAAVALLPALAIAEEAKTVTLTATVPEVQALVQLLDAATKACGLTCAQNSVAWALKLQEAVNAAQKPTAPSTDPEKH